MKDKFNGRSFVRMVIFVIIIGIVSPGYSSQLVEVTLQRADDLNLLMRNGFDVTNISQGNMAEVILHSEQERNQLQELDLRFFTAIEDVEEYYANRLQIEQRRDPMGGYLTLDELVETMNTLHEDYPDIIGEPISIGETIEGRDIWAFRVSDNPDDDEDEPEVLFTSSLHPREVITPLVLFHFVNYLAEGYEAEDDYIMYLVDERQMWFIPCHNPDGYAYNEEIEPDGGGMWRKNRRDNDDGTFGVDLNRNWGHEWGYDNIGSNPDPDNPTYRGVAAFSEPETQAAREFINDHNFTVSLYFHAWGNLCLYPPGYDYYQVEDRSTLTALAKRMVSENQYLPGNGWEAIYRTNGDSDDWIYASDEHDPIMAFTVEIGTRDDYFWPPLNRVDDLVEENVLVCLTVAEYCDNPARTLNPPTPINATLRINGDDNPVISWDAPEDDDNPPVSYNLKARFAGEHVTDDAPPDQERWDLVNFRMSQAEHHSGTHSYSVITSEPMAMMTLKEAIIAPDTLWAWMNYELRTMWRHSIALEVSYDGYDWEPIAGGDTEDLINNGINLGPGIEGDSHDEWVRTWFELGDHGGKMVKLRFRFYQFDRRSVGEKCYIDDIFPLPGAEWIDVLVENIEGTEWVDEDHEFDDELEYLVQSVDADGDKSFWTLPIIPWVAPPPLSLNGKMGWMLYSLPILPDTNRLDYMFADWVDRESLILVKDQYGNFFAPTHDFNQIDGWNPIDGYWIKLTQRDTLSVVGEQISPDTEIPLQEGWNIIGYLLDDPMPADQAWDSVQENLIIAKDGYGNFWFPDLNFINMRDLQIGSGYQLMMAAEDVLVYPMIAAIADNDDQMVNISVVDNSNPKYQQSKTAPISNFNHSLLFQFNSPIESGEIVLLDGDHLVAGSATVQEGQVIVGLAAWGEDEPNSHGFNVGELITAEWHSSNGSERLPLNLQLQYGSTSYVNDGFSIFDIEIDRSNMIPSNYSLNAYPNPFNSKISLAYSLINTDIVHLNIFDASARLVETVPLGKKSVGHHQTVWDASERPSGVYIAQLEIGSNIVLRSKLLLIR